MLAEDAKCSPTSSWWVLGTHVTGVRLGCGRMLSGGAVAVVAAQSGSEEIGYRIRHDRCFFNIARFDGIEIRKGKETCNEA